MAIGRHYRAEREFRADDRRKRYGITSAEIVAKMAEKLEKNAGFNAIAQAAGMAYQVECMNDGLTPYADAVDEVLEDRRTAGLGSYGLTPAN
ncbi:hypothetical protein [Pseudomonas sp. JBR1]|uniref:hypothetical protein n=1 Tax=Pseudomonas sp. JBR1 TaxID=3020907 RepID=UPI002305373C|nr:hypothetical protein [Pseudomonas sp. JBR1]WCE10172.1 hypothetical protein PJ259_07980 [Pseudomonas sp. JBR1]